MRRPAAALVLITALSLAANATAAQRPAPAAPPERAAGAPAQAPSAPGANAEEVRRQLESLLGQYPPSLPRVLRLDPTLLGNEAYLQPYPELAGFLAGHPEVPHNPGFFLARYENTNYYRPDPQERALDVWKDTLNAIAAGVVFAAVGGVLLWLIKTIIEHRRWTRMLKIQTDAHTKLLDRFTSSEDLLAYMQTPAGRRFFEAAPLPVETPRALSAPVGRILWSAQAGAVLAIAGIGFEVVAARAIDELSQPLSALGVVAIALGIGFGVSAYMAYALSKRLGLIGETAAPALRG